MNPIIFYYRGGDFGAFVFRLGVLHYDIEKVLERRYRNHQRQMRTSAFLTKWVEDIFSLERRLQGHVHSMLHPHANPVTVHIRKRRK
jgi:hypothetical protein